ncbi:MAG: Stk1 family PASTA domain-containing Ser/Thr kinase [Tyzzerella sp.]|nr:Stk1 family PASTA domain-containing Ser/Thr kinase [Tyzzerella sp.]
MIKEGVLLGGRYEIIDKIGSGGMANVFKAIDRVLNRYVAVKVLKKEFSEDENFVKKFWSEAQSAAGLTHANIVNVYDVAEDRGLYYIVMELVEGITLKDYIQKKGRLTPKEVIGITMQVSSAMDAAHNNNIVHRDIKPQNIIISKEGKVKVTDFGIAKATSSNTISTNVMGSVHYTSPEQARGGFSDAKSDIYSLGITMYEMITGELPFDGDSTVSIALKHLQEDIIPPSELVPEIPYSLEQIIMKCTQKSADRRYANVAALARDLKRSIQEPDGDFVKIAPLTSPTNTVIVTPEEMARIQGEAAFDSEYDDDYDEYYDEDEKSRKTGKKNSDIDPKMSKVMKILLIIASVLFVGVMVWVISNLVSIFGNDRDIVQQGTDKGIPEVVGMTVDQAEEALKELGVTIVVARQEEALKYDKGYIFKQLTAKGTELPEGAKLQVYVSTGLKDIEIPDVSEKSEEEAIKALVDAGFEEKNIKVKEEEHMTIKKDLATRTDPEAGEGRNYKTRITIYISTGVGKTFVPDLFGRTKERAEEMLKELVLTGEVVEEVNEDYPEGTVFKQEIEAEQEVDKGTVVKYYVAVKELIPIPTNDKFAGKRYEQVVAMIESLVKDGDRTFIIVDQETASTEYNEGAVVSVKEAGKSVEKGSTITIIVSKGPGPGTQQPDDGVDDKTNPGNGDGGLTGGN